MMFKKTLLAAAVLALGGIAFTSSAATNPATASFNVKLKINAACTVSTTGDVNFGNADANSTTDLSIPGGANVINVKCSKKTPYTIGLKPSGGSLVGAGVMAAQNVAPVSGNTDSIAYALYQDSGTTVWGDTAGTNRKTGTVDNVGNVTATYPVYAKVLGTNLNVTPDSYQDTVTVSVYY